MNDRLNRCLDGNEISVQLAKANPRKYPVITVIPNPTPDLQDQSQPHPYMESFEAPFDFPGTAYPNFGNTFDQNFYASNSHWYFEAEYFQKYGNQNFSEAQASGVDQPLEIFMPECTGNCPWPWNPTPLFQSLQPSGSDVAGMIATKWTQFLLGKSQFRGILNPPPDLEQQCNCGQVQSQELGFDPNFFYTGPSQDICSPAAADWIHQFKFCWKQLADEMRKSA